MEVRIGNDCLPGHLVEGDVLCRQLGRGGNGHAVTHALRVADRPLQRLHAAKTAAHHRSPLLNAQHVGQPGLAVHPVFDGNDRKTGAVALAGFRVDAGRAGGAVAAAEVVQADDEEAIGVDGLTGADAVVPPARFAIVGAVVAGGVVMAGQGVADQHRVAGAGVELTVGLVDQLVAVQRRAAGQGKRVGKRLALGGDQADGVSR